VKHNPALKTCSLSSNVEGRGANKSTRAQGNKRRAPNMKTPCCIRPTTECCLPLPIMSVTTPIVEAFRYLLQPVAPFTWFGLSFSTLDVVAAFRLCIALRQIREDLLRKHVKVHGHTAVEVRSFARSAATALTVVYGGEAVISTQLIRNLMFDTNEFVVKILYCWCRPHS
jgi:hypothetical protein